MDSATLTGAAGQHRAGRRGRRGGGAGGPGAQAGWLRAAARTAPGAVGSNGREAAVTGGCDRRDLLHAGTARRRLTENATCASDGTACRTRRLKSWNRRNPSTRRAACLQLGCKRRSRRGSSWPCNLASPLSPDRLRGRRFCSGGWVGRRGSGADGRSPSAGGRAVRA
jgi:hypothetical protein